MRHLVIMRHAKAECGEGKDDFDRELEPRGWGDARAVGAALAEAGVRPDTVLCSSARRTRDTLAAILPVVGTDCVIQLRRSLYDAEVPELRNVVRTARGQSILVIGHNPAVHGLALALAGDQPRAAALAEGFPTSAAAVFHLGFGLDTARLEDVVRP